jgi:hypothetical protein
MWCRRPVPPKPTLCPHRLQLWAGPSARCSLNLSHSKDPRMPWHELLSVMLEREPRASQAHTPCYLPALETPMLTGNP